MLRCHDSTEEPIHIISDEEKGNASQRKNLRNNPGKPPGNKKAC
jgi:hypothetical protein